MSTKRKRVVITIGKNLEPIKRAEERELLRIVGSDLNLGTSAVSGWMKRKTVIKIVTETGGESSH